jgi:serine protease Do
MLRIPAFVGLALLFSFSTQAWSDDDPSKASKSEPELSKNEKRTNAKKKSRALRLSEAFRTASERALPSVVTVYARRVDDEEDKIDVALEDLLGGDPTLTHNVGSGVILSDDGLVVTNHHVVEKCSRIKVRLSNGQILDATDVKLDSRSDLAILRIHSSRPLSPITVGTSNNLAVGEWVLAIGSPFDIEQTVSAGIISGKSRRLERIVSGQLLQTDAAINPGNSGGALVDLNGELIGINTAIASTSGEFQGVGFAIPVDRVRWVISELNTHGSVRRATMGVATVPVPPETAEQLKMPFPSGAYVIRLKDGFPADLAGISKEDVIIEFAGQKVATPIDLNSIVEQSPIGQPLSVKVLRGDKPVELSITLQAKNEPTK